MKDKTSQKNYIGLGAIKNLDKYLGHNKVKKIFLVSGKMAYKLCGAEKLLRPVFEKYSVFNFTGFSSNPNLVDIKRGLKLFKKYNPDLVIAIGGGSAIDVAKTINILAAQGASPKDYILKKKKIKEPGKKLVAIPTTAGTGSEATQFSVIYIGKHKYSLKHPYILPDCAIIDPQFTLSLDKKIAAATGADALSQALESYWSVKSTPESKKYAAQAIKLILKNFQKAVKHSNRSAKLAMSRAANLSGRAINISETTACHAISYPITSYFGVPHGQAVALTLGSMLVYNSQVGTEDIMDKRGIEYVKRTIRDLIGLFGVSDVHGAKNKIHRLLKNVGLETKLSALGISNKDIRVIIKNGFNHDRMKNNPRRLTKENFLNILNDLR
ncbi:TPA: alcohol dehydrogenase [Candidatus Falkowbacteria bacterium]|nr:MAG: Iron-containing alcohol dehydrogenase [Candidatus Falkowbacteria bacterium GW2011_GWF2_43_32]HBA36485.1 alcohol dehydrogenase [Candidatus Falkowbacteria bacterium]